MAKIIILDGFVANPGDLSWEPLAQLGELTVYDRSSLTDESEAIARIGDAEIVVTNKTPITRNVMDACPNMKFIAVLATGYNVVDCAAARARGIPVCNVPDYGTDAVAQFTFSLLLEVCHHIGHHSDSVHNGTWERSIDWCYWDYPLIELDGKTMGIIGFGRIGQATGRIAKAMGMNILATGSRPTEEGRAIAEYVDLDTLLAKSDVISLHCPLFPETQGIINEDTIAKMKDGVILINNGRGQLVAEQDLADALNSGKVRGAGLDVYAEEPSANAELYSHPNVSCTPHIGAATVEAQKRIGQEILDIINKF